MFSIVKGILGLMRLAQLTKSQDLQTGAQVTTWRI